MSDRELLEFIAAQVGSLTQQVGSLSQKVDSVEIKLDVMEARVNKIETTIENNINKKLDCALEGYKLVYEHLNEHDERFSRIEGKLNIQDVEIRVIKGGKEA